jgi:hypothetical protein
MPNDGFFRKATEQLFRNVINITEANGAPLDDASFRLLEQAAAEAAKEGRGHALTELARRAKAMRDQKWTVPDDEDARTMTSPYIDRITKDPWEARWCMERALVTPPVPARISADPGGGRHAEARHPVENVAPEFRLRPLIGQSPGVESPADDGLVAKHGGLDQASPIVT